MNRNIRLLGCFMLSVVVIGCSLQLWSDYILAPDPISFSHLPPATPASIAAELAEEAEDRRIRSGNEFYKPLRMVVDYAGVEQPKIVDSAAVVLPEATPIVGIEVGGQHYAFVLSNMLNPKHHIANLLLGGTPVSVTYCDMVDCVRVLTDDANERIPLHVGGLDVDNQMVFLLRGQRFGQSSHGLPLADFPFVRTTLGQWQVEHPTTKIYLGPDDDQLDS